MVKQRDFNQDRCLSDPPGRQYVLFSRRGIAARMVMQQHNINGTVAQCSQKNLPRRDQRRIDRAFRQHMLCNQMVPIVHHQKKNFFPLKMTEPFHVIIGHCCGTGDLQCLSGPLLRYSGGQFGNAFELDRLDLPDSPDAHQLL